jgi:peptide/bleomycin uptake transporter
MFKSFFPNPRNFFLSAVVWGLAGVLLWMFAAKNWGTFVGLPNPPADAPSIIGVRSLITPPHIWFAIYFWAWAAIFALAWRRFSNHPWYKWSVLGSIVIIYVTYFQVQLTVAINDWYGEYFNLIQKALAKETKGTVSQSELFSGLSQLIGILFVWIIVAILFSFFVSHYVFRWRTAMNHFYAEHWTKLRKVEGAAQRVQEDTMRFAGLMEGLGKSFIEAVMTLIAFLPILSKLSEQIKEVPILGAVPYSLVWVSLIWSIFGTALLALIGVRLPGLEFRNQRVEAAYRKELVYGEDYEDRADPATLGELFSNVRKNYFNLYKNYLYFNFGRYLYLQADAVVAFVTLVPAIAAGAITFGIFQQVRNAMAEVRDSMQYLVKSWPSIIDLISIYKRLRIFESAIDGSADIAADEAYGAVKPAE